MQINRLKQKIETFFLISLLIVLSTGGGFAVTRTISDTQDTLYTKICNSKGNTWDVSQANLQTAINDLNGVGMVWVGGDISTSTSTDIQSMTTVDFCGYKITYTGSTYAVRLRWGARIENCKIDMTSASTGDDVSAIFLNGVDQFHMRHGTTRARSSTGGSNINLISNNQQRTGLYFYSNGTSGGYYAVSYTRWDNVRTSYFKYGFRNDAWGTGEIDNWNNANSFINCRDTCSNISIYLHRNTALDHVKAGVEGNMYTNFQTIGSDSTLGLFTKYCLLSQGQYIYFESIIRNWGSGGGSRKQYYFHDSLGKHQFLICNGNFSDIDDSEVSGGWNSIYIFSGNGQIYSYHQYTH